jgi:predicted acetyltransferase
VSFEVRACRDLAEYGHAFMQIGQYFGMDPDAELAERFSRLIPLDWMQAAWEKGSIVGGTGAFPFELSVPGGALPCAGTTVVGVAPTHRRRGVLRALMRAHIDDVHERGHPLAALWASEETIYGRFGYGRAAFAGEVSIAKEYVQYVGSRDRRGTVRIVGKDEAFDLFPPLWDALGRVRPGPFTRSREWWEARVLADPKERRRGAGPKRFAVLDVDGEPAAYAIYRHKMDWDAGVTTGAIVVVEAVAADPGALAEMWRFLLDIDWVASIDADLLPPDHPLFFVLAQPRRMRYRMGDGIWVRLVDVGAALSGRSYVGDDEVVLEVRDAFCPWNEGRWRLAGGMAARTEAAADLVLDVSALGSVYLGGFGFTQLAQAGLVEEQRPGALARADALFRHALHPWCPEIF